MTIRVDILNPKARKLLADLADLNLISIREERDESFMDVVTRIRDKAKKNPISLPEITKEVEKVRAKRYAKKKG